MGKCRKQPARPLRPTSLELGTVSDGTLTAALVDALIRAEAAEDREADVRDRARDFARCVHRVTCLFTRAAVRGARTWNLLGAALREDAAAEPVRGGDLGRALARAGLSWRVHAKNKH